LPKKYLRSKREWRFYVHEDVEYQLRQALAERSTGAGDRFLLDDAPVLLRGVPVMPVPVMKITTAAGSGTNAISKALLAHPKNLVMGIQRAISIETDRKPRARVVDYVVSVRSDFTFEEEDAIAVTEVEHAGTAQ